MNNMKHFLTKLSVLFCIFTATAVAEEYDFNAAKAVLDSYVQSGKVSGSVVLVTKDGKTVLNYATGKQDVAAGSPMKTDSLFRIASQSKALTSIAVMILQEQGKLSVTDPVSKYIPAFKNTTVLQVAEDKTQSVVPAKREITIHDFLTHSSGISYGWGPNQDTWVNAGIFDWYFGEKDEAMLEALKPITGIPHSAQPGEQFVYGHSTDILGALVAKISGMSLRVFFKKEITGPLGMKDTDFIVPTEKLDRLATVYNAKDGKIVRAVDVKDAKLDNGATNYMHTQGHYTNPDLKAFSGGAGLISTAADYTKLLVMLLNGGELDGMRILSTESVSAMTRDQIPYIDMPWNDGFGYAFSMHTYKVGEHKGKVSEYGWGGAYHSTYIVRPIDKVTIVYLTQLIPTGGILDWDHVSAAIKISMGIKP
jgi:CubicO group peptidase (beta-lactamase class C family)